MSKKEGVLIQKIEFKYVRDAELIQFIKLLKTNYKRVDIGEPKMGEKFMKVYIKIS